MTDEAFIRQVLKLAKKGRGCVNPNPMVGAIIVNKGRIIARGYHRQFGGKHAEVAALNAAPGEVSGGTLYVNLEPCTHHGKQPPCVEQIIRCGIEKVVIGARDPNPHVTGQGVEYLRQHGVQVTTGVLEETCLAFNAPFFKHIMTGLPFITLKIAQTLDGRIAAADGGSKWISSKHAREKTHRMRAGHDAILVGIGTVLSDDPQLNVRHVHGPDPRRVIVDSKLRIPLTAKVLNDDLVHQTIITAAKNSNPARIAEIRNKGAEILLVAGNENGNLNLNELVAHLGKRGITSLLVEGGSRIFSSFLKTQLVDRLEVFLAPKLLGSGLSAIQGLGINSLSESQILKNMKSRKVGDDILITADVVNT